MCKEKEFETDPVKFIRDIIAEGSDGLVNVFGEEFYINYIELMNKQVFNRRGVELCLRKFEEE